MWTGRQIKAARAFLGWSQETLSEKSGVSLASIRRLEPQKETPNTNVKTLKRIVECFEDAGMTVSYQDGRGSITDNL